ncbi:hypothetical protein N431DRAFT_379747 [Stipitochalara longipes BDJ]|nr:hypothetical protein N431DRAFT_379747 [Stipitochalara longipes BDJ]
MASKAPVEAAEEEKPVWFGESGKDGVNEQLLKPAKEVVRGRDQFKQKLQSLLKKNRGNVEPPKTKEELEKEIAKYNDYSNLKNEAGTALNAAARVNSTYNRERTEGGKKIGRVAQGFVHSFSEFLGVYSGIVNIMKGAGQVYGEVAYETLSILFIVVVNKGRNDSGIGNLLNELRKSFPQLDDWTLIYPTASMKQVVAEVYKEVITFARDASIYFTRFRTRLWMAIGNPPAMGVEKTASIIHGKLAEVTSEAMLNLHKRNQQIQLTVEESKVKIEESQITIEESHSTIQRLERMLEEARLENEKYRQQEEQEKANADKQRLETFKGILEIVTYPTAPSDPDICANMLSKAFKSPKKPHYQHMTRPLLESLPSYKSWFSSSESSVLLLAGETNTNARAGRGYTHSWLSSATLFAVDILRENDERGAYYCCHPGVRTDDHDLDTYLAKDLLIKLSYKLLESQPKVLRRKLAQLQSIVSQPAWTLLDTPKLTMRKLESWELKERQRTALSSWFALLREILEELKIEDAEDGREKFTYLIIDRVDLVEMRVAYFMEELKKLVGNNGVRVKVLAVLDTVRGEWDEDLSVVDDRVLVVQGLDQKPVGTFGHTFSREER